MTPTITRAAFAAWLAQFPDEDMVGFASEAKSCPIASFLISEGATFAVVGDDEMNFICDGRHINKPLKGFWLAVREAVDSNDERVITAGTAREILARIPDDEEMQA